LRRLVAAARERWVVLLGLVGVAALIVAVDPAKVARAVGGADPLAAAIMIPVVFALYICHGVAWWIALRGIGAPVGLRQAVKVTLISQAFDVLPGGDLWRVPIVRSENESRVNAGTIAATVIFDDLVYFFVLTFAMVPLAIASPVVRVPLAIALAPQLAIFTALLWPSLYAWLAGHVSRMRPFRRFEPQLAVLGPTFQRLVVLRVIGPVVLVDALCAALAIGLYGLAMSAVHAAGVGLPAIAFTYATGQVLSGLTVLPGALGAYEGMMTGMMALQGVTPATAAAAALLYRAVNDLLMAVIGLTVALSVDRGYLRGLRRPAESVA
jgi:glycosyltransferase 2 family protein